MKVEPQCRKFSFVKWVLIIAIHVIKFEFKNIPATHEGTYFKYVRKQFQLLLKGKILKFKHYTIKCFALFWICSNGAMLEEI